MTLDEFLRLTYEFKDKIITKIYDQYFNGRKFDRKNYDDFYQMKNETKELFDKIDLWDEMANKNVHRIPLFPNQIKNTVDNLEIMVLHSYFHDVRKKRFIELHQSVLYNLDLILNDPKIGETTP
ncbi:DUF1798 family protein [Bacillaceae bacterium W0354]